MTTNTSLHIDVPDRPMIQSFGWYVDTVPSIGHVYETTFLFDDSTLTIKGTIKNISWSVVANDDMSNGAIQHAVLHFHKDLFVSEKMLNK